MFSHTTAATTTTTTTAAAICDSLFFFLWTGSFLLIHSLGSSSSVKGSCWIRSLGSSSPVQGPRWVHSLGSLSSVKGSCWIHSSGFSSSVKGSCCIHFSGVVFGKRFLLDSLLRAFVLGRTLALPQLEYTILYDTVPTPSGVKATASSSDSVVASSPSISHRAENSYSVAVGRDLGCSFRDFGPESKL